MGRVSTEHRHVQQMTIATMGIDIGKNSFHVWLDRRAANVPRRKWSCGQIEVRLAAMPDHMEACVGAHHLSRKLQALGPSDGSLSRDSFHARQALLTAESGLVSRASSVHGDAPTIREMKEGPSSSTIRC